MNTPEWLKPGLFGAVAGGVPVAAVGFAGAGLMRVPYAARMGQAMVDDEVTAALVPVCVERSNNGSARDAKLATLRQATSTAHQRDAVLEAGWATIEGDAAASRTLAAACVTALEQRGRALAHPTKQAG